MENIIVSKDFLEKILFKFNEYTISHFEKSTEIDIESFLFFKRILTENKSRLYLDISADDILKFKEMPQQDVLNLEDGDRCIAEIIRSLRGITFGSKQNVYDSLSSGMYEDIIQDDLPCFLLLADISEKKCIEIENAVGINCYSLKRLKVEKEIRVASLHHVGNTQQALFDKINLFNYHTISIYDQYFIKNMSSINNNRFYKMLRINTQKKLTLQINSNSSRIEDYAEFENRKRIFEAGLQTHCEKSNISISCQITNDGKHDRYINTNIMINILGNSLFANKTSTHLTCYPKILYSDFKF